MKTSSKPTYLSRTYVRHGFGAVRPYVYGNSDLAHLVTQAFGGVEIEREQMGPDSFHVEVQIGDAVAVLELGEPKPDDFTIGSIYVYVQDVDNAYKNALAAGATSVAAPENKPYNERAAGVKDSHGNIWWMSTYKAG